MPEYPAFVGGSYVAKSPIAANARTVNFYCERQDVGGGAPTDVLYPTPGVTLLDTAVASPGRAHFAQAGREFAVIGPTFYEINSTGTLTSRGTVAIDSNPATICSSGDSGGELFITSGNNGYIFTLASNTFALVRTGATTMGDYLDGFFLALDAATSTLYLSNLNDGTTWDPTQYAQRSIAPDPWIAMKVWDRYIWLFGSETSEIWYDAGTAPFPFAPHPSGLVEMGCAAPFSPEIVAGAIMFLARNAEGTGSVMRAAGFTPEDVSTFPIHVALESYSTISSAVGDAYELDGHSFYILTFADEITWAYDATVGPLPAAMRWTERGTWIAEDNQFVAWRPLYHAFCFGQHRMLDRNSGALYQLDANIYTDVDSRPIVRLRRPPAIPATDARLFVSEFEVGLESGLGLQSGQGSNPQMSLRISTNGGKTWGAERDRSAGAVGQYSTRVFWTRCGSARRGDAWQPEIVVSDPIPWRITGANFRPSVQAR